jgi:hypothetical protein
MVFYLWSRSRLSFFLDIPFHRTHNIDRGVQSLTSYSHSVNETAALTEGGVLQALDPEALHPSLRFGTRQNHSQVVGKQEVIQIGTKRISMAWLSFGARHSHFSICNAQSSWSTMA